MVFGAFGVGAALLAAVGVGYAIGRGGCPQCTTIVTQQPVQTPPPYFIPRDAVQGGNGTMMRLTVPDGIRTCVPENGSQ